MTKVVFFDIETHSADKLWDMEPEQFFRLGQYAYGDGDIHLTTDYNEMVTVLRRADLIIGHNVLSFDLKALFRENYLEVVEWAKNRKIVDTFYLAHLHNPAPNIFTDYSGHTHYDGNKPAKAMRWLSLENQAHNLGVRGKFGDLKELAKQYNPAGTKVADLDYGLIPLDDVYFLEYARQDVVALRDVYYKLLQKCSGELNDYAWREMLCVAIDQQISVNGFRVDVARAEDRVAELRQRKHELMHRLAKDYGLPTEGKQPWRTTAGKEAIFAVLAEYGITPESRPDWVKTATGNVSLGGDVVTALTAGTDAEELGLSLAELMGQRSLAELALESVKPDGRVHPDISSLQRSGRRSVTNPGLTIWTSRGEGAVEKSYFIASEGSVLIEMDYSNADARVVAAVTGDKAYAERFAEGVDAHELTGRLVFGADVYDSNPTHYRQIAKMLVHAYSYGCGYRKLSLTSGQPESVTKMFVDRMNGAYPDVTRYRGIYDMQGKSGRIWNWWGRQMVVEPSNSYTQSFALIGQSGTTEIMKDALIRFYQADPRFITWIVAPVHDALVFDIPEYEVDNGVVGVLRDLMEVTWYPADGQSIDFPVGVGSPARDWASAGH